MADISQIKVNNTAYNLKDTEARQAVAEKAALNHTHNTATSSADGFMSHTDKEKLDKMVVISESAYNALDPPDSNTIYFVLEASGS